RQTGKAAGWQFHGYLLDDKRRPAFRYSWNDLTFEDYPVAVAGQNDAGLRRIITVHADQPVERLFFRAAVGKKINESEGRFTVDDGLNLQFPGGHAIIRGAGGNMELLVPVNFTGHEA